MNRTMWFAVAAGLALTGSAEAQVFRGAAHNGPQWGAPAPGAQYYVGPGGQLYYVPGVPTPGVAQPPTDPCCPCPPGSGPCKDDCTNPPRITYKPYNCPPSQVCTPIDVTVTPGPTPDCMEIPFYGKPVTSKQKVNVPVRVIECEEVIRFKDYTIDLKCCEITVCVPCERCVVKRERCVEQEREVTVEAYRRRDQTIDVYAIGVAGLPTKYVLKLKMMEQDFKAAYPSAAVPTYP